MNGEHSLHGLKLGGGHAEDALRIRESIQCIQIDTQGADADAKLMTEAAQGFDESFIIDRFRDDEFALRCPTCGAEGLEEIG